jgi:hypothetical protein
MNNPSIEELEKLMDYYGTAMQYNPLAQADLIATEQALQQARQESLLNDDLSDDQSEDDSFPLLNKRRY